MSGFANERGCFLQLVRRENISARSKKERTNRSGQKSFLFAPAALSGEKNQRRAESQLLSGRAMTRQHVVKVNKQLNGSCQCFVTTGETIGRTSKARQIIRLCLEVKLQANILPRLKFISSFKSARITSCIDWRRLRCRLALSLGRVDNCRFRKSRRLAEIFPRRLN